MILGEALLLRADLQKQILSLRDRLELNAKTQENESPSEHPQILFEAFESVIQRYEQIVVAINKANFSTKLADDRTLTEVLAHREVLKKKHITLLAVARKGLPETNRYSEREIKWVSVVDVKDLRKQADIVANEIRELNVQIQKVNWETEINL